jgi:hypothetical protein
MQGSDSSQAIRRHDNAATWEQRLEECRQSGMPVRAFCRQHGIVISSYYRWHLKLKGRVRRSRKRPALQGGRLLESPFIPVHLKESGSSAASLPAGTWACEVTGLRRVRLRLRERPDWRELLQLLAVMAGEA